MATRMPLGGGQGAEEATRHARLRRRLRRCLPHFHADKSRAMQAEELRHGEQTAARDEMKHTRTHTPEMVHSWSDTEDLSPVSVKRASVSRRCGHSHERESLASPRSTQSSPPSLCSAASSSSVSSSKSSASSTSRKGVTYAQDGALVSCRFCEILREGQEPFLYEDEDVVVFRPLAPVVASHLLVVPRRHIRNVNQLTADDAALLQRMRGVAASVLREMPRASTKSAKSSQSSASEPKSGEAETDFKFAFHTPPFNSIDHVHMHAFRLNDGRFGCVGSIKYRTETWWCRSFDEIMTRLGLNGVGVGVGTSKRRHDSDDAQVTGDRTSASAGGLRTRRHHASHPPSCGEMHSTASTALTSVERFSEGTPVVA